MIMREYRAVFEPKIKECIDMIKKWKLAGNKQLEQEWSIELKKNSEYFKLARKQAIEIKKEANASVDGTNIIDLHSMTLDEAMIALDDKIKEAVRFL